MTALRRRGQHFVYRATAVKHRATVSGLRVDLFDELLDGAELL